MKVLAILYNGFAAAEQEPRLLGTVENKLGMEDWLKSQGHEFIVTSDKEGPDSDFQKHIVDAEVLITTPFHPGYLTKELFAKAKNLKLCVTAGVGSDHIDLNAAVEHKVQVLEVSGSNVVSVAGMLDPKLACCIPLFSLYDPFFRTCDVCRFSHSTAQL
jgi:formate dehydrogenase